MTGRVLRALTASALVLPLVVAPSTLLYPYVAGKAFLLTALAIAAGAVLAGGVLLGRLSLRHPSRVTWAGAAALAVAALSTVFAVDRSLAFWDAIDRMLGLFTYGIVGLWFMAAFNGAREAAHWRMLLRVQLAVGWGTTAIAAAEWARQPAGVLDPRVAATLGHPAYLGALGLLTTFFAVVLVGLAASRRDRVFGWVSVAVGLVAVALSGARAAALGVAIGAVVVFVVRASAGAGRRRLVVGLAAVAAVGVIVFLARDTELLRSVSIVRRAAALTSADSTLSTRLLAWDVALDAARERPLLGWGPNCYSVAFAAHYRPEFLRFGMAETWFDDAHGVVFNTLVEQGLAGLAAFVAVVVVAFQAIARGLRAGRIGATAAAGLAGLVAAHCGALLFSFEDLSSLVGFALALCLCEHVGAEPAVARTPAAARSPARTAAAVACGVAAAGLVAFTVVLPAMSNARAGQAVVSVEDDPSAADERITASARLPSPFAESQAMVFAWTVRGALPKLVRAGRVADADALGRRALECVETADAAHPLDVRTALMRASVAERTPALRRDAAVTDRVRDGLERAVARAPRRQDLRFALAGLATRTGNVPEATAQLRAVLSDDPLCGAGWARLAALYAELGRVDDARRILSEAEERGVRFEADDERKLAALRK